MTNNVLNKQLIKEFYNYYIFKYKLLYNIN